VAVFRSALAKLGWTEGSNLRIELRWAAGDADRIRTLAKELVDLRPNAILGQTTSVIGALARETQAIPIVFVQVSDPIANGFTASLARPGGNITGFTTDNAAQGGKWVDLLKEIAPRTVRVALLFNPATVASLQSFMPSIQAAASSFAIKASAAPAAIATLQNLEKETEAKAVLDFYVAKKPKEFWNNSDDVFLRGRPLTPAVSEVIASQQRAAAEAEAASFDLEIELPKAAKSFDGEKIKALAQVPIDDYYRMFKSKKGDELTTLVLSGLEFRRISNATDDMREVVRRTEEGLKKIASESKLNAARVGKFGVKISED